MLERQENFGRTQREKPNNPTEKLIASLKKMADQINLEAEQAHGLKNLVKPDCSVSMEGFSESQGGIYSDEAVRKDQAFVGQREVEFSGANLPSVQEFYRTEHNIPKEVIVDYWKKQKRGQKNGQMEMATTLVLHKILGEDFLVVNTASLDDYKGSADNIILNRQTGEIICAFDEVHEGGRGDRTSDKKKKIEKIAKKGGTEIRYGISLQDGKLVRSRIENVPVFYLRLDSQELTELLVNMNFDPAAEATPAEKNIFGIFLFSIREQLNQLESVSGIHKIIRSRLAIFESTLSGLEKIHLQKNRAQPGKTEKSP